MLDSMDKWGFETKPCWLQSGADQKEYNYLVESGATPRMVSGGAAIATCLMG